jgi:hypothetical protein
MRSFISYSIGLIAIAVAGCDSSSNVIIPSESASAEEYLAASKAMEKKFAAPVRVSPKAVVETSEFDFGNMDPGTSGFHEFEVRNEGSAPLELELLETSCKCTVGSVDGKPIPPGGSTKVRMEWNTGNKVSNYSQWAQVATNDSENATLTFKIRGTVRQVIRFEPEEVVFGQFLPTDAVEREVLIYSDKLKDFRLPEVTASQADFVAEVTPASAEKLASLGAVQGYVVRVKTPTDLLQGEFLEYLKVEVQNDPEEPAHETYEIPLKGRVMGRLSVVGAAVDGLGRIELGVKRYGEGGKVRLKVKVRDNDPDLTVRDLKVKPEFLKVQLVPLPNAAVAGLYDLIVELPRETEPCSHRGDNMGTIHFDFDHPRIPKLDLLVDFSVRPPEELR